MYTDTINKCAANAARINRFERSDKRDPDVQFVSERDQHRPATPAERIPVYQIEVETK